VLRRILQPKREEVIGARFEFPIAVLPGVQTFSDVTLWFF
jgi:hypothetical protein